MVDFERPRAELLRESMHIACGHESQGVPSHVVIPDYKPITPNELAQLMIVATGIARDFKGLGAVQALSIIQIRLDQAIPGMTCPRPYGEEIERKSAEINKLYIDELRERTPDFVSRFFEIIQMPA